MLNVALKAAEEAGKYLKDCHKNLDSLIIEQKNLHDYVSEVDRHSEKIIVQTVLKHFPEHSILGEEYGRQGDKESDYQWVIDPLDGTTNFLRSIPHFAISIALRHQKEIILGVVYDPIKSEMFHAEVGQGAYLNGQKIVVSQRHSIVGALLSTGIPFSGENLNNLPPFLQVMDGLLARQTSGIRRLGAAALDLAYVAAGRYDGFWEAGLQKWDIAAGILLVTEAGGKVSGLSGDKLYYESGNIVAATPGVLDDMLEVTTQHF